MASPLGEVALSVVDERGRRESLKFAAADGEAGTLDYVTVETIDADRLDGQYAALRDAPHEFTIAPSTDKLPAELAINATTRSYRLAIILAEGSGPTRPIYRAALHRASIEVRNVVTAASLEDTSSDVGSTVKTSEEGLESESDEALFSDVLTADADVLNNQSDLSRAVRLVLLLAARCWDVSPGWHVLKAPLPDGVCYAIPVGGSPDRVRRWVLERFDASHRFMWEAVLTKAVERRDAESEIVSVLGLL